MKKLILLSFVVAIFFSTLAFAQSCGENVASSITLTSNIGPCTTHGLIVSADNVVIDCNGFTISGNGPGSTKFGIFINGFHNIEIKNCNIESFQKGIVIVKSNNSNIHHNNILNNLQQGIYGTSLFSNIISSNVISSNTATGFYLQNSANNIINLNTIQLQDFGLSLVNSQLNNITNNTFNFNNIGALNLRQDSHNNNVISNIFSDNKIGVQIENAQSNRVQSNTIQTSSQAGIYLRGNIDNTYINANTIKNNNVGIESDPLQQKKLSILTNIISFNTLKDINLNDAAASIRFNNISNSNVGLTLKKITGFEAPNNFISNYICNNNLAVEIIETDMNAYQPDFVSRNNWCGASNGNIAESYWQVMVRVVDKDNVSVENANVKVFPFGFVFPIYDLFTGAEGLTESFQLVEFEVDAEGNYIARNPYTFRAEANGMIIEKQEYIRENRLIPNEVIVQLVPSVMTLYPIDDAYISQTSPNTNYGLQSSLQTRPTLNQYKRTFIKFNLSELNNKTVVSAVLRLWRDSTASDQTQVSVFRVDDNTWRETIITWNNQPPIFDLISTTYIAGGSGVVSYDWDVSQYIINKLSNEQEVVSMALKDAWEGTGTFNVLFRSEEYSGTTYDPVLIVEYTNNPANTTPDITPPTVTLNQPGDGSLFTISEYITFFYTATDERATVLTCTFYSNRTGTMQPEETHINVVSGVQDSFSRTFPNGNYAWNVQCSDGVNNAFAPADYTFTVQIIPSQYRANFTASADTFVDEINPEANYGTKSYLSTKPDAANRRRTFLKFNLSNMSGMIVTNAILNICRDTTAAGYIDIDLWSVADISWIETAMNWNNQPAMTNLLLTKNIEGGSGCKWYQFDVTPYVQNEIGAGRPILSFGLVNHVENTAGINLFFRSREYSGTFYDPYLEVSYTTQLIKPEVKRDVRRISLS